MKPVGALGNCVGAGFAQGCEVGRQDGRRNDGWRRHGWCGVDACRESVNGKQGTTTEESGAVTVCTVVCWRVHDSFSGVVTTSASVTPAPPVRQCPACMLGTPRPRHLTIPAPSPSPPSLTAMPASRTGLQCRTRATSRLGSNQESDLHRAPLGDYAVQAIYASPLARHAQGERYK